MRKAYVAKYPLNKSGNDLDEIILARDTYWSPAMGEAFKGAVRNRRPEEPMVQGWYADDTQVTCMASTNQPFRLP